MEALLAVDGRLTVVDLKACLNDEDSRKAATMNDLYGYVMQEDGSEVTSGCNVGVHGIR